MSKPDFGPGDLVVCVDAQSCPVYGATNLRVGRVYRVERLHPKPGVSVLHGFGFGVFLKGCLSNSPLGFHSKRFRKIDKADDEFTAQIRACRPVPGKVSA